MFVSIVLVVAAATIIIVISFFRNSLEAGALPGRMAIVMG